MNYELRITNYELRITNYELITFPKAKSFSQKNLPLNSDR